ncbi:MAG: ABC transporter substrate-binding protein [Rubrivivax sp.]|nr:ABC transporter substrate-binding protein [Rubrivivax sp.]
MDRFRDTACVGARRPVLALLGAALLGPAGLRAQDGSKAWRIAFLAAGSAPRPGQFSTFDAITAGLRERGYGALQTRAWFADGRTDALPALAQHLLAWQPDVIVTNLTPATLAVQRATRSIPIVMAGTGDPVATGLVQSLARPGGNVTGVSALGPELAAKSIELLRELQPGLKRLGVLAHATDSFTPAMLAAVMPAAAALGLQLQVERVAGPGDYAAVFERWRRQQAEAVFVQPSLPGAPAAELALQHGLPSCSFVRGFVAQGGLLAYANDLAEIARLVVDAVDRILRGASPAQLPVQQNTRFGLLINLRTARALGVAVPPVLLARATEVLE